MVARTGTTLVRREPAPLAPWVPPDPEAIGVSRRMFFNRATVALMTAGIATFAAASFVAFLWPFKTGGFGGKVAVGNIDDIKAGITAGSGFFYAPEARTWITAYPPDAIPKAEAIYSELILAGMRAGIVALYQKCPHLGCRVPQCVSSQWFECPCHGSQYNRVGEKKAGPAPRGMDRFPVTVAGNGDVTVDTGVVVNGPADRHQHHRPGGRGATLHRAVGALMPALATTSIAWVLLLIMVVGWIVYAVAQRRRRAPRARLGDRAGGQPQAVPRRRGARGSAARDAAALQPGHARDHRHRPPPVLDPRAVADGRRDRRQGEPVHPLG